MLAEDFQCIVTVAQMKNITQAAEKMYMSQPALSRRITAIEKNIGEKLFERTTREILLTPAGRIYYEHALKIVKEFEQLCSEISGLKHKVEGTLRVGYSRMMGNPDYLVSTLAKLAERYPDLRAELVTEPCPGLLADMEQGKLDCAIMSSRHLEEKKNYTKKKIHTMRMYCVMPNEHLLAGKETVSIDKLENEAFLMMKADQAPDLYNSTMMLCQGEGFTPKVNAYTNSIEELLLQVRAGRGIALLSSDLQGQLRSDVTIRPVDQELPNPADRVLAWRKDCENINVQIFWKTLQDALEEQMEC